MMRDPIRKPGSYCMLKREKKSKRCLGYYGALIKC
jgi:hypothetical protein